jgi:hypothetical protein
VIARARCSRSRQRAPRGRARRAVRWRPHRRAGRAAVHRQQDRRGVDELHAVIDDRDFERHDHDLCHRGAGVDDQQRDGHGAAPLRRTHVRGSVQRSCRGSATSGDTSPPSDQTLAPPGPRFSLGRIPMQTVADAQPPAARVSTIARQARRPDARGSTPTRARFRARQSAVSFSGLGQLPLVFLRCSEVTKPARSPATALSRSRSRSASATSSGL